MRTLIAISCLLTASFLAWQKNQPAKTLLTDKRVVASSIGIQATSNDTEPLFQGSDPPETSQDLKPLSEDLEYTELMKTYLGELLQKDRWMTNIAHQTEIKREIRRIAQLDVEESIAYWEILQELKDEYFVESTELSIALIENVAWQDANEAISMLLLHDEFTIDELDYENVVRLWMDQNGTSVMELYEELCDSDSNFDLVDAMDAVYAEEAPLDYILGADPYYNDYLDEAISTLYLEQGVSAFDQIINTCQDSDKTNAAFAALCHNLRWDDKTSDLKNFLSQHRYQASDDAVKEGAEDLIFCTANNNKANTVATMNWALDQQLLSPEDSQISYAVKQIYHNSPETAQAMVDSLVQRTGTMNDDWQLEDEYYFVTDTLCNTKVRTNLKDLETPLSAITAQFLSD